MIASGMSLSPRIVLQVLGLRADLARFGAIDHVVLQQFPRLDPSPPDPALRLSFPGGEAPDEVLGFAPKGLHSGG